MDPYTFKKSTCERYDIRFGRWGWAIFTIDENGGLFNCQSDYGDYSYSWPNHGRKTFKHFIIEIAKDGHYLLNKVAEKDFFDFDEHLKQWKKTLIEMRRERHSCDEYTKENIREAWDFLCGLGCVYSNSTDLLINEMMYSDELKELGISEPWETFDVNRDYSPQANAFAKEIMPMFADILKKELGIEEVD
jgi:hypothetical protein